MIRRTHFQPLNVYKYMVNGEWEAGDGSSSPLPWCISIYPSTYHHVPCSRHSTARDHFRPGVLTIRVDGETETTDTDTDTQTQRVISAGE
jgi:hypothetical protein